MTDKSQSEKFKQAARDSESEMDEEAFEEALRKVAKKPLEDDPPQVTDANDKEEPGE